MNLTFYTRQGCPLCEEALVDVKRMARKAGATVDVVDIDLDLRLLEQFNERVPVVATDDGAVVTEGIIDLAALKAVVG